MNKNCPFFQTKLVSFKNNEDVKFALQMIDNKSNEIITNIVIPIEALICPKCNFISLFHANPNEIKLKIND